MYELTKHEELILVAVWKLQGNAYIVTIRQHIQLITQKTINYGSLCNTLASLMRKGYLRSKESAPISQQGGRRKIMYNLTPAGNRALNHAYEVQKLTWEGFADLATKS